MTRPNGVTTNYTYDNLSRLLSVLHQLPSSTIDGAVYTVDAAGNRISKADQLAGVTSNYSYDAIYELTQVTQGANTTESYSYDPVGNRLSSLGLSPYNVNSSNELTSTPSTSYSYDYNGNLTSETTSTSTTGYSWDFENRLTQVTLPNSGGTVTFKYDPFGRRIEKISPNATSIFAYDGNDLVETANSSGSTVARYTDGSSIDEPLAMQRGTTTDYYEADGLGSITSLTATNGSVAQRHGNGQTEDDGGPDRNSGAKCKDLPGLACQLAKLRNNLQDYLNSGTCPSCGSLHHNWWWRFDGNNSNSFAFSNIENAGLSVLSEGNSPGYHRYTPVPMQ